MLRKTVFETMGHLHTAMQTTYLAGLFDTNITLYDLYAKDTLNLKNTTIPNNIRFKKILLYPEIQQQLTDVYENEFKADSKTKNNIALLLCYLTNTMLPQVERVQNTKLLCVSNPMGSVSRAEFFDNISAIRYGANGTQNRAESKDNMVYAYDYFNMGYNMFCTEDSPIYRKISRLEMIQPITWLEVVYYLVFAFKPIREVLNLTELNLVDFSMEIKEDITQAEYNNIELAFKVKENGLLEYDILEKPIVEYMQGIMEKKYKLPYMFWYAYLRLLDLNIIHIDTTQLFTYISREQMSVLLIALTEFLVLNGGVTSNE